MEARRRTLPRGLRPHMGKYQAPNSRLTNQEPASWHVKTHTAIVVDVADVIVGSTICYWLSAIG